MRKVFFSRNFWNSPAVPTKPWIASLRSQGRQPRSDNSELRSKFLLLTKNILFLTTEAVYFVSILLRFTHKMLVKVLRSSKCSLLTSAEPCAKVCSAETSGTRQTYQPNSGVPRFARKDDNCVATIANFFSYRSPERLTETVHSLGFITLRFINPQ